MDEGVTAHIVVSIRNRLGVPHKVSDLTLRESTSEDRVTLLVDFVSKDSHVLPARMVAVHYGFLVQSCPEEKQDGQVGELVALLVVRQQVLDVLPPVLVELLKICDDLSCLIDEHLQYLLLVDIVPFLLHVLSEVELFEVLTGDSGNPAIE